MACIAGFSTDWDGNLIKKKTTIYTTKNSIREEGRIWDVRGISVK